MSINDTREEANTCLMNPGRTTVHYDAVTLKPHGRVVADVAGGGRARGDFIKTVRKFDVYTVSVSNQFDVLLELNEELGSSNEIWEKTKDAILCSAKETLRKPNTKKINKMLSSATIDLVVKRRELKSQDHSTNRRGINDLTRDIRRSTRQD
eukprot:gene4866-21193_t